MSVTVSSLTPDHAPVRYSGIGDTLVIIGTGFSTPVTRVWFHALFGSPYEQDASFVIISDTEIHVTVPTMSELHFLEAGFIGLDTAAEFPAAITPTFTPDSGPPPRVHSIAPTTGAPGDPIIITGTGFLTTGGFGPANEVKFNGVSSLFHIINDTTIATCVPPGTPTETTGIVVVTNPNGNSPDTYGVTTYYRSLGLLYDEQLMAVPSLSLGPMVDEQFQGVPALSLGPLIDEILESPEDLSSALDLTSSIVDEIGNLGAIDSALSLIGSEADNAEYSVAVSSALDFVSSIALLGEWSDDVQSAFDLVQLVNLTSPFSISSALDLVQDAVVTWPEAVTSDLSVLQAIVDALSTLVLTDAAFDGAIIDGAEYNDSVGSAFDLSQLATSTMVKPGTPTGVSECDASYLTFAPISLQKTVTFSWDSLSVTVRAPEFNNDYATDTRALIRKNRGGEPRIQRPTSWVIIKTLRMHFIGLSVKDVNNLVHLLSRSAGREITLLDHENTTWVGVVTNQTIDVIESVGACANEVDVEFRGVRS